MVSDWIWAGLLTAGAAYEVWTIRNVRRGDTLTETTRRLFRTHTTPGRLAFLIAWVGFAAWFTWHIIAT